MLKTRYSMEIKPMKPEIENAIKLLAEKITSDVKADDALKFTQAALNLAHIEATLAGAKHLASQRGGQ